jgi:carbonic anhydrase/acetyltransferase-like protein (isoleucine patch superfamily)
VAVYALAGVEPTIDPTAYVHPDAVVVGEVTLGAEASVWPCAVLRGDPGGIVVGARTSIQDGTVVHTTPITPTRIGSDCVVGHLVHLEGCTIGDRSLVGSGAIVLNGAVVEDDAQIAAGAVVSGSMVVPQRGLAIGVPATIKPERADPDAIAIAVAVYQERGRTYRADLRRLD